jgi:hypothetical protein
MPEPIDLNQVVYFLETARTQVKNIFSKHGTNGKDSIQQNLEEALKELRKAVPARPTQESAVPAA